MRCTRWQAVAGAALLGWMGGAAVEARAWIDQAQPVVTVAAVDVIDTDEATPDSDPVEALRAFLLALATHDREALHAIILPNPEAAVLLEGRALTPDQLEQVRKSIAGMKFREVRLGETLLLPGGARMEVTEQMVSDNRRMLLPRSAEGEMPTPFRVERVDGVWRVDARPVIAARKAAEAARQRLQ